MTTKISCQGCYKKISSNPKMGVKHYQQFHSDQPETCYRQFNMTWDTTLTRVVKGALDIADAFKQLRVKLDDTIKQLENENKMRLNLATKLNGIIMILQHEQK